MYFKHEAATKNLRDWIRIAIHNTIVVQYTMVSPIILFQKKCFSVDDLPFHVQQGLRKGRCVERGK